YMVKEINGENKYDNSEFNSHVRNVGCNNCDPNWGNSGKLDGGTLKVSFSEHGLLSMGIGEVKEGKKYVMKFSTIGDKNIPLTAYVRQSGSPWQQISGLHTIEVSSKRQEHELIFSPKVGMDNSRVEFRLSQKMDANVWMDNLEFYEIDHEEIKQEDFLLFEYNATQSKKTIPLNGDYVDAKNGEFSNKVVLDPFQSVLLLKTSASSSEPEPDPYPEIQIESPANNSEFRAGEEIEINVKASLKEGSIKRVDFFNDGKLIGSSNDAPFSYIWKEANVEEIKLSAVAIGDNGNQKNSDIILLNVLPAPVTKDIDQPGDRDFSLFLNVGSDVNTSL
ncbi:MAG: Ig-like domain-containing protein, partial [Cyclobacteriaceae bacterium]